MENENEQIVQENEAPRPEPAERRSLRLPLSLVMAALLVWFGFQTAELVFERSNLISLKGNYDAAAGEAEKMRAQLQALIAKTTELAGKGNASAKIVVEELQKKGVPIASAAPPAK